MTEIIFLKPDKPRSKFSLTALKPAYQDQSDTITSMQDHLKENKQEYRFKPHPSRCQAINRIKQLGWIISTDIDIVGDQPCASPIFLKSYNVSDDYNIIKYESDWSVYIPPNYNFIQIPTLYHTGRWYTFPGIMNGDEGCQPLNTFLIMKKNDIIPANTPLFQYFLQLRESTPKAIIREKTLEDTVAINNKAAVFANHDDNRRHLAVKEKLLYNPLYQEN